MGRRVIREHVNHVAIVWPFLLHVMMSYCYKDSGPFRITSKLLDSRPVIGDTTELPCTYCHHVHGTSLRWCVCFGTWDRIILGVIIGLFITGKMCWSAIALWEAEVFNWCLIAHTHTKNYSHSITQTADFCLMTNSDSTICMLSQKSRIHLTKWHFSNL